MPLKIREAVASAPATDVGNPANERFGGAFPSADWRFAQCARLAAGRLRLPLRAVQKARNRPSGAVLRRLFERLRRAQKGSVFPIFPVHSAPFLGYSKDG
jgi:hypothetical protein